MASQNSQQQQPLAPNAAAVPVTTVSEPTLLGVPGEVRNRIYYFLIGEGSHGLRHSHFVADPHFLTPGLYPLLRTSRVISREARTYFYGQNRFYLFRPTTTTQWLRNLRSNVALLRRLDIFCNVWTRRGWDRLLRSLARQIPELREIRIIFGRDAAFWRPTEAVVPQDLLDPETWDPVGVPAGWTAAVAWFDDDFIRLLERFQHLTLVAVIGDHHEDWMDRICRQTGSTVRAHTFRRVDNRDDMFWFYLRDPALVWREITPNALAIVDQQAAQQAAQAALAALAATQQAAQNSNAQHAEHVDDPGASSGGVGGTGEASI